MYVVVVSVVSGIWYLYSARSPPNPKGFVAKRLLLSSRQDDIIMILRGRAGGPGRYVSVRSPLVLLKKCTWMWSRSSCLARSACKIDARPAAIRVIEAMISPRVARFTQRAGRGLHDCDVLIPPFNIL